MRGELAHAFRLYRVALADELFEAIKEAEWSSDTLPAHLSDVFEWWRYAVFAAVDLAGEWVNDPNELLSGLFAGWIFNLDHPLIHPVGAKPLSAATVLRQVKPRWAGLLDTEFRQRPPAGLSRDWTGLLSHCLCRFARACEAYSSATVSYTRSWLVLQRYARGHR